MNFLTKQCDVFNFLQMKLCILTFLIEGLYYFFSPLTFYSNAVCSLDKVQQGHKTICVFCCVTAQLIHDANKDGISWSLWRSNGLTKHMFICFKLTIDLSINLFKFTLSKSCSAFVWPCSFTLGYLSSHTLEGMIISRTSAKNEILNNQKIDPLSDVRSCSRLCQITSLPQFCHSLSYGPFPAHHIPIYIRPWPSEPSISSGFGKIRSSATHWKMLEGVL